MTESETRVPCGDLAERDRFWTVFLNREHKVVLKAPPGEVGVMTPRDVSHLREVLRVYAAESTRLRGSET